MKIAVIGTGIAGNVVAYKLRQQHDITVYEAAAYIGGHSNTIDVCEKGEQLAIDTGFIVFNDRTYPEFIQLLKEIGQESQRSEMSFSVRAADGKLEYNGKSLNSLFVQRSNIWRPGFYRMLRDILRFNAAANFAAEGASADMLLRDFLQTHRFRDEFVDHYLVPMAAAIWSAEPAQVMDMPVKFLVQFFANHGLLQLQDRPEWRVISGGSRSYVNKLVAGHRDRIRLNSAVNPATGTRRCRSCPRQAHWSVRCSVQYLISPMRLCCTAIHVLCRYGARRGPPGIIICRASGCDRLLLLTT